jgi:hypothetical protein
MKAKDLKSGDYIMLEGNDYLSYVISADIIPPDSTTGPQITQKVLLTFPVKFHVIVDSESDIKVIRPNF